MNPVVYLSSVARATAVVFSLAVVLIAVSTTPFPSQAGDKKPVAGKDVARATAGEWTQFDVLSNDYDPDGTKVRLKSAKKPKLGKVKIKKNKKLKYKPKKSAKGRDVIRYVIRDRNGKGKKAKGKVVVNVEGAEPLVALEDLCDHPSVILCEGFEEGQNWNFFKPGLGSVPPQVVCGETGAPSEAIYEGDCALQITHDRGASGPDVGGSVAYDFPANSVYVYFRMKSNGLIKQLGTFNGSNGSKFVQVVEGTGSCSSDSVNLNDNWGQRAITLANSCGGLLWRVPTQDGDKNYQPIGSGDTDNFSTNCTRRHLGGSAGYQNPPRPNYADLDAYNGPCVIYRDDRWFAFEIKMFVNEAVKLWVDDGDGNGLELVIDLLNPDSGSPITEPRRRIFFQSYKTDYDGSGGAGKWEVWYDNFVVSTDCIATCGL